MTESIIDLLEPIQIQTEKRKRSACQKQIIEMLSEKPSVRQIRQYIVPRQVSDLRFRSASLRNVFVNSDPTTVLHRLPCNTYGSPVRKDASKRRYTLFSMGLVRYLEPIYRTYAALGTISLDLLKLGPAVVSSDGK